MKYVELHYERIANLIAVAASHREKNFGDLYVKPSNNVVYTVSFSDYVKSQIHLDIVSKLFSRQFLAYQTVYKFLQGGKKNQRDMETVLNYFYEDVSNFLIYNPYNIRLVVKLDVAMDWLPEFRCNYSDTQTQLLKLLDNVDNFDTLLQLIEHNSVYKIIDSMLGANDAASKIDSYTNAALLLQSKQHRLSVCGGIYSEV